MWLTGFRVRLREFGDSHTFTVEAAMQRVSLVTAMLSLAGSVAVAQGTPKAEVGTLVGVTILRQSGASFTRIGIPGDGIQAAPTLYATIFMTPSVMVEPQLAFTYTSFGTSHATVLAAAGQLGYLFSPAASESPYVAANVAFEWVSGVGSGGGPAAGVAAGYRFTFKSHLAIRFDARYRRWFGDFRDLNEIGFGFGLGATF